MKNILIGIIISLALATPAAAQVVGQGTIPWVVAGTTTVPAISATGTLGALNATVTLTLTGQNGVGFRFTDAAFVGSVAAELSMDGGVTWTETDLYLTLSATTYNRLARLTSPGLSANFAIATAPGTTGVRLKAITYVSGSAAITLSATSLPFIPPLAIGAQDSFVQGIGLIGGRYGGISGTMMPSVVTDAPAATNGMGLIVRDPQLAVATGGAANGTGAQVMVKDNTSGAMAPATSLSTSPVGTEPAQLVRNIPSGIQNIGAGANIPGTGTITALNGTVTLATGGEGAIGVQVTGVWVATLKLQGTLDGSNWEVIIPYIPASRTYISTATGIAANGIFTANIAPYAQVRLIATAFTSGTATVTLSASAISATPSIPSSITVSSSSGSAPVEVVTGATPLEVTITKTAISGLAPATASVGVASASAVAANASRKGLIIVNVSTATVCFGFAANPAVLNSGICLQPGAAWNMTQESFVTGIVNAIASAAASVISIQEFQ